MVDRSGVPAYLRLIGPDFVFDMHSYPLVLGRASRKPPPERGSFLALPDNKNISRNHCVILWDSAQKCFTLSCLGKNGATLNGTSVHPNDAPVPLTRDSRLVISSIPIFVLLPKQYVA
jgi:hypothetical protein